MNEYHPSDLVHSTFCSCSITWYRICILQVVFIPYIFKKLFKLNMSNFVHGLIMTNTNQSHDKKIKTHLQDRSAHVEVCPWCISAGTLCPGQRRPRATTATVCIYSMYSVNEGEDINGAAKFWIPCAINLEQFAINSVGQQFYVSESVQRTAKDASLWWWTITNNIWCYWSICVIVAPSINVLTYL